MDKNLYTIYDKKSEIYAPPFVELGQLHLPVFPSHSPPFKQSDGHFLNNSPRTLTRTLGHPKKYLSF